MMTTTKATAVAYLCLTNKYCFSTAAVTMMAMAMAMAMAKAKATEMMSRLKNTAADNYIFLLSLLKICCLLFLLYR